MGEVVMTALTELYGLVPNLWAAATSNPLTTLFVANTIAGLAVGIFAKIKAAV